MTLRALHRGMFSRKRKGFMFHIHAFPFFSCMTGDAFVSQRTLMRIPMTGGAIGKGQSFVDFILVTGGAGYLAMGADQRKLSCIVIKSNLFHRPGYRMTGLARREPSHVLVFVTGRAIGAESGKGSGFVTACAILDG